MKMRRCEDEKMFYRPPLLEEPCAQTLSVKKMLGENHLYNGISSKSCLITGGHW